MAQAKNFRVASSNEYNLESQGLSLDFPGPRQPTCFGSTGERQFVLPGRNRQQHTARSQGYRQPVQRDDSSKTKQLQYTPPCDYNCNMKSSLRQF